MLPIVNRAIIGLKTATMTKIIGLIGFKQVGKSTAAKYLEEHHGFMRHNMKDGLVAEIKQSFPDLLQEIATEYNDTGYSVKLTPENLFEYKPPLMRALMINYGTEVRRRDDPDYWVKLWRENLPQGNVVADDIRFLNEAKAVKDNGGILIRLVRSDIPTGGNHPSETEQLLISPNYVIESERGGEDKVYKTLDEIVANMV